MSEPSIANEFTKLIPVVIGGLIAIFGGIVAQTISNHFSILRDRNKLLREKGEELIFCLQSQQRWISKEYMRRAFNKELDPSISPLDKAQVIQLLYFPELSSKILEVIVLQAPILNHFHECEKLLITNKEAWLEKIEKDEYTPMFQVYLGKLSESINATIAAVKERLET